MIIYNEYIEKFLTKNGWFTVSEPNVFINDLCEIHINNDNGYSKPYYKITFKTEDYRNGASLFSDNLEIYWLIGALTYNGLMDKNYNILDDEE